MSDFDPLAHSREKARKLERRVAGMEEERDKLYRLLVLALSVACGKTNVSRLALLSVLEDLDRAGYTPQPLTDLERDAVTRIPA